MFSYRTTPDRLSAVMSSSVLILISRAVVLRRIPRTDNCDMFGELQLKTFQVEVVLDDHLIKAKIQPRGSMLVYLNDRRRPFLPFEEAEIYPLAVERQVNVVKQPDIVINKRFLKILSLVDEQEAQSEQLLASKRPVAFYAGEFVIQGQLHVNADAKDQDLLDETKDYFAMSEASIYPIKKIPTSPTRRVPLLFISRTLVQVYHIVAGKD